MNLHAVGAPRRDHASSVQLCASQVSDAKIIALAAVEPFGRSGAPAISIALATVGRTADDLRKGGRVDIAMPTESIAATRVAPSRMGLTTVAETLVATGSALPTGRCRRPRRSERWVDPPPPLHQRARPPPSSVGAAGTPSMQLHVRSRC